MVQEKETIVTIFNTSYLINRRDLYTKIISRAFQILKSRVGNLRKLPDIRNNVSNIRTDVVQHILYTFNILTGELPERMYSKKPKSIPTIGILTIRNCYT